MNNKKTILEAMQSNIFAFLFPSAVVFATTYFGLWTEAFSSHVFGVLVALFMFHTVKDIFNRNK